MTVQIDIKATLATRVEEDGTAIFTGGYQGTIVKSNIYIGFCGRPGGVAGHGTETTTYQGTVDSAAHQAVSIIAGSGSSSIDNYVPIIPVDETVTTTSPDCPTVPPTIRRTDKFLIPTLVGGGRLADPAVPRFAGSNTETRVDIGARPWCKRECVATLTKKWNVTGCGEGPGPDWVTRFPPENTLSALKEPFQLYVGDFIDDLKHAGAKVARAMAEAYVIHEFGPAYPSNHSSRLALDMNIFWKGTLRINLAGPWPEDPDFVKIPARPPYWIDEKGKVRVDRPPKGTKLRYDQDMNPDLWRVGRSYGVIKLVGAGKAQDPPHWSATGR